MRTAAYFKLTERSFEANKLFLSLLLMKDEPHSEKVDMVVVKVVGRFLQLILEMIQENERHSRPVILII